MFSPMFPWVHCSRARLARLRGEALLRGTSMAGIPTTSRWRMRRHSAKSHWLDCPASNPGPRARLRMPFAHLSPFTAFPRMVALHAIVAAELSRWATNHPNHLTTSLTPRSKTSRRGRFHLPLLPPPRGLVSRYSSLEGCCCSGYVMAQRFQEWNY